MNDWRYLPTGSEIPTAHYCDQPYVVQTDDGAWLCLLTTGAGIEGEPGQFVAVSRSTDQGKTWTPLLPLEDPAGVEASYGVLLKTPAGRVYAFYNHNTDNIREVKRVDKGVFKRVDSLGYYVFRYSDDHGQTWSKDRYVVPMREFEIDRENVYAGDIRFHWNVGRPFTHNGAAYLIMHKVGNFGPGFFVRTEGAFMRSANLLTETDAAKITFDTLPEGDVGLRAPEGGGPIAEEQSVVVLSDGSFFCVYRTIDGSPAASYSRDEGRTWSPPAYLTDEPTGEPGRRRLRNPRAANFIWRVGDNRYLYWFHHHGGKDYEDRNPAWVAAAREVDSPDGKMLTFSQPEVLLYDDDPWVRMSYPDLIVQPGGRLFITETQKDIARVHEIDAGFLNTLWTWADRNTPAADGLLADWIDVDGKRQANYEARAIADDIAGLTFRHRAGHRSAPTFGGATFDLWFELESMKVGQTLFSNVDAAGRGVALTVADRGALQIRFGDEQTQHLWASDIDRIATGRLHHAAVIFDAGPAIVRFVIDGVADDGGPTREFGWGRFSPNLAGLNSANPLRVAGNIRGRVTQCRVYDRPLMTTEVVGNHRAGPDA